MEKISLADQGQIEKIRMKYHHELSSHAFVNLFLWQEKMKLSIEINEDSFFVKEGAGKNNTYFYPCGSIDEQRRFIDSHIDEKDFEMTYVRNQDKKFLMSQYDELFDYEMVDESSEYVFERESLSQLNGKNYSNVRNQMNRLNREHHMKMIPFQDEYESLMWEFIKNSPAHEHVAGYQGILDDSMIQEVMKYRKELGIYAVTVWVDGQLRGVTFGFPLTEDTMDGCIEKHDISISGLSYYTQMALILQAPEQFQYMNAEEDLGLHGIRTMKRHMNPCRMNTVWRAKRKMRVGRKWDENTKRRYFFR